jgi:putative transposase
MALPQSALSELLDAIRAGGSGDVMREATTLVLQELIEVEAAQAIGAARYERTEERARTRADGRGVGAGAPALPGRPAGAPGSVGWR